MKLSKDHSYGPGVGCIKEVNGIQTTFWYQLGSSIPSRVFARDLSDDEYEELCKFWPQAMTEEILAK